MSNKHAPQEARFPTTGADAIARDLLTTIPYRFDRHTDVLMATDEFSALCPYNGLPDYGSLTIRYIPSGHCVELKSFKYYLASFRNVGVYQEDATNLILEHLVDLLQPVFMEVTLDYNVRGGIHTVTRTQHGQQPQPSEPEPVV